MGNFGGNVVAQTGEPIYMLFWMKTWGGPKESCIRWGADPQRHGKRQFSGVVRAIQKHWQLGLFTLDLITEYVN